MFVEVLSIEIEKEIHHFAGWEGGGLRGTKIVNKHSVNKLAFLIVCVLRAISESLKSAFVCVCSRACLRSFAFEKKSVTRQRRKKRTRPPPKESLLGKCSGRKDKLSRPMVDAKTL